MRKCCQWVRTFSEIIWLTFLPKDADAETDVGDTPATVRAPRAALFQKPVTERTAEEQVHADEVDLRCLSVCIGMLERVNGVSVSLAFTLLRVKFALQTLEENSTLDGILQELIIPAMRRKELVFREKGFVSLGLFCLIARVCDG